MTLLKKSLVWAAPVIISIAALLLLFAENYSDVTEPPTEGWSRGIELGLTPTVTKPQLKSLKEGQLDVSYLTEKGVKKDTFNQDFELVSEETISIPVDKFTEFSWSGQNLIYSDYQSIFIGESGEKLSDISGFFPLKDQTLYSKDQELFKLDTDTLDPVSIMDLKNKNTEITVTETEQAAYIMTRTIDTNGNHLKFYEIDGKEVIELGKADFRVQGTEEINDLQFSVKDESYSLLVSTLQKQSAGGELTNFYYFAHSSFGEDPQLQKINFPDPHSRLELKEVSDIEMTMEENSVTLLFKGFGATKTTYADSPEFNIYKATLSLQGNTEVIRLSNTPSPSAKPVWFEGAEAAIWVDQGSDNKNKLMLSSANPSIIEQGDRMNQDVFIQSLGKTVGMFSTGMFSIVIAGLWFIWPLFFIVIITFSNSRAMDHNRSWIFYTGTVIYLAAAILFRDSMFTTRLMARAPEYLSFQGSSIIYLFGFALLTYLLLSYGVKERDWSVFIRLTYFIGVHVILVTVFFGPYLL
ncbi:hypothetical protein SAMN05216353_1793 [Halobacillus alkaliphilus]|uniref:Uncharacterized protein n=1 Tax=Halobacillus alkaliphilus TaxID=396056 RepID=A0A1I2TQQ2_9BACI|nr:hypothetical protein SAMN05216353_1793 [Halobacillus alkaliphilus]